MLAAGLLRLADWCLVRSVPRAWSSESVEVVV